MEQKIDLETIRKEMIDKSCEWLLQHFDDREYWLRDDEGDYIDFERFLEDFKKAMTEQK